MKWEGYVHNTMREAVARSGRTHADITENMSMHVSHLAKLTGGSREWTIPQLEKVCDELGWELHIEIWPKEEVENTPQTREAA